MSHGAYPGFVYRSDAYKYFMYREDPEAELFSSSLGGFWSVLSRRAAERPLRYASWYFLEKPYYFWSWGILQGQGDVYVYPVVRSLYSLNRAADATRVLVKLIHPGVLVLGLAGMLLGLTGLIRRRAAVPQAAELLALTALVFTLVHVIFAPWPRYSVPLRPELMLLVAWALSRARARFVGLSSAPHA